MNSSGILLIALSLGLSTTSQSWGSSPSEQTSMALRPSITVTRVKPTGAVTGGQQNTVTADVVVVGVPDGVYDVTIVVWDYNMAGNTSATTTGTVTITGGVGTVNIPATFPVPTASGDTGIVQVEVQQGGVSGADQSNISY